MVVFDLTACTVPCTLSMRMTKSTPTCIGLCVCITSKERRRSGKLEKTKVQGAGAALSHMTTQQTKSFVASKILKVMRISSGKHNTRELGVPGRMSLHLFRLSAEFRAGKCV
jgi:hypothetical protein